MVIRGFSKSRKETISEKEPIFIMKIGKKILREIIDQDHQSLKISYPFSSSLTAIDELE